MPHAPGALAIACAYTVLFLGGGAAGLGLARLFAPGSWLAEAASFFALPLAFAFGLQLWYGLAILSLLRHLVTRVRGGPGSPILVPPGAQAPPGAAVFLALSTVSAGLAGIAVAAVSPRPAWGVLLTYSLVGAAHGALARRLARRGYLPLPEPI